MVIMGLVIFIEWNQVILIIQIIGLRDFTVGGICAKLQVTGNVAW